MTLDLTKLVMTRDGLKVEFITTSGREPYQLIGYVGDGSSIVEWRRDGKRLPSHETQMDLINVPEPKRVVDFWLTAHEGGNLWTHVTLEEAAQFTCNLIATIHIRWTEGKGAEVIND